MADKKVGTITHFFDKLSVGIIKLDEPLEKGSKIRIQGNTTNFEQIVNEMQFDRQEIDRGQKGQEVGIKVDEKVREDDKVFLVE